MQDSDIEAQMLGIIGVNSDIDMLGEKLFDTPKKKAKNIIDIAYEMTEEDDKNYNTIMALKETEVLKLLVEMPKEERENYIETFASFLKDREKKKISKNLENENKFEQRSENTEITRRRR